jgi:hypothetical protein
VVFEIFDLQRPLARAQVAGGDRRPSMVGEVVAGQDRDRHWGRLEGFELGLRMGEKGEASTKRDEMMLLMRLSNAGMLGVERGLVGLFVGGLEGLMQFRKTS